MEGYLKGGSDGNWRGIGISIMATQASAITFLSTPGQAYADGMRFLQFYFGLPVAMILLSIFFLPIFYKLKVYTAYEYLENRFDRKTRTLSALLFLVQRGLAAGITIYAPAIILSTLLGLNLTFTNVFIGFLVIIYTVSGGTKAVTQTQKQQMAVMMGGMILAGIMVIQLLPADIGFQDALHVAGKMGKLEMVDFSFDIEERYTFWSGMTAALFLFMSYFGTDQSQVQRYLSGRSLTESRLGLMMNGLLKVPMQFIILFIGVMVFVFFQFNTPPMFFNKVAAEKVMLSEGASDWQANQLEYDAIQEQKKEGLYVMLDGVHNQDEQATQAAQEKVLGLEEQANEIRSKAIAIIEKEVPEEESNDKDYVFMTFVMTYLPIGMIGLLFAVMFSAAMSSTASELNALATTTTIDIYKRSIRPEGSDNHYVTSSKWFTLLWGILAIVFATTASLFENLIQAVNLLGSLFYGTILGIFLVAFFLKKVQGNAVFIAALLAEALVIYIHYLNANEIAPSFLRMGYLWYNILGCMAVLLFAWILQLFIKSPERSLSN